ncbi:metallophosphoesterase [Psychrobacillus sp. INOP01]|uniref:metallophosphoesterase family protein n=1 Tax=Psychrobacillus sp. INOP01 TaxID=2829187 RepID=UPI001BAB8D69|nr:metallophosphoesterase [Psychrobacillus sp. INOP01]QUG42270.1 metallophosphoesterase [Psychrobacillus sp. INOP01]
MKLLIMSDTHSATNIMEKVIEQHQQEVDAIIHCGDSELNASYFVDTPIHVVRGNCDIDDRFPLEELFSVQDAKVLVVHGHKYNVKSTLMPLFYRAKEVQASVVCFGHSHLIGAEMQEGILFINPGSLQQPRGRKEKSYAIAEKNEDSWTVLFYSDEHILLEKVTL